MTPGKLLTFTGLADHLHTRLSRTVIGWRATSMVACPSMYCQYPWMLCGYGKAWRGGGEVYRAHRTIAYYQAWYLVRSGSYLVPRDRKKRIIFQIDR